MNREDLIAKLEKLILEIREQDRILEEKDRIIEEKDRILKEKRRAMEEENCVGWILKKGLPQLKGGMADSAAQVSQQTTIRFQLEEASELGYLADLNEEAQKQFAVSDVWRREKRDYYWASIPNWVQCVIQDCIESIPGLIKKILCKRSQISFPNLETKNRDVVELSTDIVFSIMGAVEVKKPTKGTKALEGAVLNFDDCGQLVQYMHDLRAVRGVRFVFGIYTNYTQWCFYWFKDSDAAAKETSLNGYLELCSASQNQAEIPETLVICRSKVFNYNDADLVLAIRTIVFKWAYGPCDRVGGFLASNRLFQTSKVNKNAIKFEKLPNALKSFSYEFKLHPYTKIFYFLAIYHETGDGIAAVYTTREGNLGAAKFRLPSQNGQNMKAAANKEAAVWDKIWNVKAKVIFMSGLYLCPLASWNHSVGLESAFFDSELMKEDKYLQECKDFKEYRDNPLKAAEVALRTMIYRGYSQPDGEVAWRHVALLPTKILKANWTVRPIIIDLTRVIKVEKGKEKETFDRQLGILKFSLPNAADQAVNSRKMKPE